MVSHGEDYFVNRPTSTKGACQTTSSCRDYVGFHLTCIALTYRLHYVSPSVQLFLLLLLSILQGVQTNYL